MKASRQAQRGAVTLIAALFIIVVLSVVAVTLLRMTGSNLLDSAAHNDALEALFIVETGIEHASFRYAKSNDCKTLSGIGPVNVGRGNFSLIRATIQPGNVCRIRVTASAGSTTRSPAVRTVDADLRLGNNTEGSNAVALIRWQEVIGN